MNKVILMGRLTRDPEVRYSQGGENSLAIARYTLAVDRRFKRNGDDQTADFIGCVAFGRNAEFAEKYFRQGLKVVVTGRIQTGSYTKDVYKRQVKDPMDLLYLFWAITTGITAGAGMYVLAVLAAVIMIVMIYLFYHRQQSGKIYIVVIHYTGDDAGDEIIRSFGKIRYFIKSKTMRKEKTEMAVEVFCRQNQMDFTEKIRKIENVDDVTLIQYKMCIRDREKAMQSRMDLILRDRLS